MSQYGDGDYCSVFQERWVKAKKHHRCHACGEDVAPGACYHVTFSVFDGTADTTKRCARCQAIFEHLSARMRVEGDAEEFCDAELNCGHEYKERWREEPPAEIAALAFWRPGDPVPEKPAPKPRQGSVPDGEPR